MFWTKRTGHLSDEDLSAYIDGELTGGRLAAAQRHVASCPDCSAAIAELREVKTLVSRLPMVEPSRSFVLTPQMAGQAQKLPQPAPRRSSFVLVPAVALTLLVALFAVDLTTSGSNSSSDESTAASQAMVAKDASSNAAADTAGGAAESQQRSTFAAPSAPNPAPGPEATPQPQQREGSPGSAPPAASSVSGPSTAQAESAPGSSQPVPSPNPAAAAAPPPSVPAPSTGSERAAGSSSPGTLSSEAAAGNAAPDTFDKAGDDGAPSSSAAQGSDEGTDWLRVAEAIAAVVLVVSALYVFGPGLIKKGH